MNEQPALNSPPPAKPQLAAQADLALLARIGAGDVHAFRELYEGYQPRLGRFLSNLIHHPHAVEEVLDDTLMVVWNRAASFKGESKLSTWIFAIAYRKAMKALRKLDLPIEDLTAETRESPDAGPDDHLGTSRTHALLRVAMKQLSAEHRAVVDLTYFHDLSYREIADILECPVDTVKTRMFYARRHLKRCLEGELTDWI